MRFRSLTLIVLLAAAVAAGPALSQERPGVLKLLPQDAVTQHEATLAGRKLDYTATAGTLDLFGQDGQQTGAIFYTAYIAKNAGADRPITFAFNGGPGAASAFLHLGLVGPRILDFGPQGRDGANAKLVDNAQSWLDFTDLVLIDPIGTGWSRTAKADDAKNYYNVPSDAEASPRRLRSTSRITTGLVLRNTCSARAMAASAPLKLPERCRTVRELSSPVPSCCRRFSRRS